jgi:tetratricopeptide (TPR) repeat protein
MTKVRFVLIAHVFFYALCSPWAALAQNTPDEKQTEAIDFAHGLLQSGLFDMAVNQYEDFIATYPQSLYVEEATFGIAESYYQAHNFPKAVEVFKQFKEKFPNSIQLPRATLRLGQMAVEDNGFDQAIEVLRSINFEGDLKGELLQSFYFYLGKAFRGKNDSEVAYNYFQKATEVLDATTYTAYAFQEMGELRVEAGRFNDTIDNYNKALSATQDNAYKGVLTYKIGEALFLSGNYADAIKNFRQVLEQFPGSVVAKEALTNLLLAELSLKQYEPLLNEYQTQSQLIKDEGDYFDIHFAVLRAYVGLQKYDEALKFLEKLSSFAGLKAEDLCRANVVKADILAKQNKFKESLELIEGSLASCTQDADKTAFLKAESYFGLGDFEKALKAYEDVKTNFATSRFARAALLGMAYSNEKLNKQKEAADLFSQYSETEADQSLKSEALYRSVLALSKTEDTAKALAEANRYLKTFPDGPDYERVLIILGDLYTKAGPYDVAIELLNQYLSSGKTIQRPDAIEFLLGYNLQLSGKTDEALDVYSKIALNKDDPQVHFSALKNSAVIFLSQKKDPQAAQAFEQIIKESEKPFLDLKTYLWVAEEYLREKKFNEVLQIAEKAEAHYPGQMPEAFSYFKAEAYRELKDYPSAAKFYDAVLTSPTKTVYSGAAHIGKGLYLMATNTLEKATAEFEKTIEENPADNALTIRARFELANAANVQNNPEEALKFYLLVGTIYQNDEYCPQALKEAATILENLKRNPEAVKIYQQILQQYPDSPEAQVAQERLKVVK